MPAHMPVNHPLVPLYRFLAALCGLYVLAFGVLGLFQAADRPFFAQQDLPTVLGLHANRAFAVLSIVVGVVVVVGAVIGGNIDQRINLIGGIVFLAAGMAMLTLLRTDLNFLGFTISTCIVSFIIGLVLFTAGLYGHVGAEEERARLEDFRHGTASDPKAHAYDFERAPKPPEQTEDNRFA